MVLRLLVNILIIGETDSSIDNPVDGTAISHDSDPSDGRIV